MKVLSVILPNYNHAHWLRRALRAHAEQAGDEVEILVVDIGATDDSITVVEQLARSYSCIRLLRMRPFSPSALAAAWWRSVTTDRAQRARLQPMLSTEVYNPAAAARHTNVVRVQA
jgi:cellulose synthase/poly-beta-1,6-N-acetylglucosamine synthase-like glycosyltransferase